MVIIKEDDYIIFKRPYKQLMTESFETDANFNNKKLNKNDKREKKNINLFRNRKRVIKIIVFKNHISPNDKDT